MRNQGTPKTLIEAINIGLLDACLLNAEKKETLETLSGEELSVFAAKLKQDQLRIIEIHVVDWLRQQFGWSYLVAEKSDSHNLSGNALAILRQLAQKIGVENEYHGRVNGRETA